MDTVTVISSSTVIPNYPMVILQNWHVYTVALAAKGITVLNDVVPPNKLGSILSAIGANHTYISLYDGIRACEIRVWKDGANLACEPLPETFFRGSEMKASCAPLAVLKIAIDKLTPSNSY